MKESEAKEKWCPMGKKEARTYSPCLASGCMWWVWDDENPYLPEEYAKKIEKSGGCGAVRPTLDGECSRLRDEVDFLLGKLNEKKGKD